MTKEELEKFMDVLSFVATTCPEEAGFNKSSIFCSGYEPNCIACWYDSIENELNKLEESNV